MNVTNEMTAENPGRVDTLKERLVAAYKAMADVYTHVDEPEAMRVAMATVAATIGRMEAGV